MELTDEYFQKHTFFLYSISSLSPLFVSVKINPNQIPHFYPFPFSISLQPPLETSLSSSLDGNGSPFCSPLSQPISRSRGGAAVCRYMWGETCWVNGERTALWATCQPVWGTSIQHEHSGLETKNRRNAPLKNLGTRWNTVIRWKIHSTGEDAGLPLVHTASQLL